MHSWVTWITRLYPRRWRVRYEEEMIALLEQHPITVRTMLDLGLGAAKAHLFWRRPGLWWTQLWVGVAFATVFCFGGYSAIQQPMRWQANFPQEAIVSTLAASLATGSLGVNQLAGPSVDLKQSLAPFVVVYNEDGTPETSTGILHGEVPLLPRGVLHYTAEHGTDRITWQPASGVRIAAVIEAYQGTHGSGYVLAGRSLRVVEDNETAVLRFAEALWCALMAALVTAVGLGNRKRHTA